MKPRLSLRLLPAVTPLVLVLLGSGTRAQTPTRSTSPPEARPTEGSASAHHGLRILAPHRLDPTSTTGLPDTSTAPAATPSAPAAVADGYEYVPVSIEPIAGRTRSRAYGINALGQVAARCSDYDDVAGVAVNRQAFVWDPTTGAQALPTLDGESGVWDINDGGFVSGYSFNPAGFEHAVRWDVTQNPLTPTDLGTLTNSTTLVSGDTSTAYGLSPLGDVTGYSDIPNDAGDFTPFHAILYTAGTLQDLGTLSTAYPEWQNGYSISYSATADGSVVGTAHSTEGAWHFRPFLYDAGAGMRELPRGPLYNTTDHEWYAVAINDDGLIGGHVIVATDQSLPHYWPTADDDPVALVMPATYPYGEIYGVNATGTMVGIMWNDLQEERAFIHDPVNGVRDLNSLIDPATGWTLEFARDINDDGQIVGSGTLGGLARGFLLTPAELALGHITIDDASVTEGDDGTRTLSFTVTLSEP